MSTNTAFTFAVIASSSAVTGSNPSELATISENASLSNVDQSSIIFRRPIKSALSMWKADASTSTSYFALYIASIKIYWSSFGVFVCTPDALYFGERIVIMFDTPRNFSALSCISVGDTACGNIFPCAIDLMRRYLNNRYSTYSLERYTESTSFAIKLLTPSADRKACLKSSSCTVNGN